MKYIYVGNVRTGSGSLFSILDCPHFHKLHRNSTSKELRDWYGEDEWKASFKFGFVRNPFSRFISAYSTQNHSSVAEALSSGKTLFKRQVDFFTEPMDYIGHYENLEREWEGLRGKLGIDKKLPHDNKCSVPKVHLSLDDLRLVREYYKEDFKRFGYD